VRYLKKKYKNHRSVEDSPPSNPVGPSLW